MFAYCEYYMGWNYLTYCNSRYCFKLYTISITSVNMDKFYIRVYNERGEFLGSVWPCPDVLPKTIVKVHVSKGFEQEAVEFYEYYRIKYIRGVHHHQVRIIVTGKCLVSKLIF